MKIRYERSILGDNYLCDFCGAEICSKRKVTLKYQTGCNGSTRSIADLCQKCFETEIVNKNEHMKLRYKYCSTKKES